MAKQGKENLGGGRESCNYQSFLAIDERALAENVDVEGLHKSRRATAIHGEQGFGGLGLVPWERGPGDAWGRGPGPGGLRTGAYKARGPTRPGGRGKIG